MPKIVDTRYTQDRELSWLRFNERVLEEAKDESVPLMERLKFAAIFTSNLDEFFMIRVGSLCDLTLVKEPHFDARTGQTPDQQLSAIYQAVTPLYKMRDKVVDQLEKRLRTCNICRMTMDEMDTKERKQVENWFRDELQPILSPQVVDSRHPFPHLSNKVLNIVLRLQSDGQEALGLIPIPQSLPPYFVLRERGLRYILTEDVLLEYAKKLFPTFSVQGKAVCSVTRNADISPEDEAYDVDEDYRQHMRKIVKKRNRLAPVRLEIQSSTRDEKAIEFLCSKLKLSREQVFFSKCPLRMNYVFSLEGLLPPESKSALCYPPYPPRFPACLRQDEKILPQILRHDALLFYPFESMDPFLHLVREASSDPNVLSIKITIYRLASKAKLAEYLCAAAENGKEVTVLMELRARFDEQNNIQWAERMEEAGCTILYGTEGFKVHSKICLITRRERGKIQYITQVGTGNYNEKTSLLYTDLSLMTANQAIGAEAEAVFDALCADTQIEENGMLLVAPHTLRNQVLRMMDEEIQRAAQGLDSYIGLKLNSISDKVIIEKLMEASAAGVHVDLIVRGICCVIGGIPGKTEHIHVRSIVGRYLEHSRIYIFGTPDRARVYMGSADYMPRNTIHRVEVAVPLLDPAVRARVLHIFDVYLRDNCKARLQQPDGTYVLTAPEEGEPLRNAQEQLFDEAYAAAKKKSPRKKPAAKPEDAPAETPKKEEPEN